MWFQSSQTSLKLNNKAPLPQVPENILVSNAKSIHSTPIPVADRATVRSTPYRVVMPTGTPSPSLRNVAEPVGYPYQAQLWPRLSASRLQSRTDQAPNSEHPPCRFMGPIQTESFGMRRPRCSPSVISPSSASWLQCNEMLAVRTTPRDSQPTTFFCNVPLVQPTFPNYDLSPPGIELSPKTPSSALMTNIKEPDNHARPGSGTGSGCKTPSPQRSYSPDPHLEALIQQESWILDLSPTPVAPHSSSKSSSVGGSGDDVDVGGQCFASNNALMADLFPHGSPGLHPSQAFLTVSADQSASDIFDPVTDTSCGDKPCSPEGGPGSSPLRENKEDSKFPESSFPCSPVGSSTAETASSLNKVRRLFFVVTPEHNGQTCLPSFQATFPSVHVG